jgi:hypothetical protein
MARFNIDRFPELYASLNTEMPEEVIWNVLLNNVSVDEAMFQVVDEYQEIGLGEPAWMDEFDFDDVETLQQGVNQFLGITPEDPFGVEGTIPSDALAQAGPKLEIMAELVTETLDDPTDMDEFEALYDEVLSAMTQIADDDVDRIMNLIDSTDNFQVIADTVLKAERAVLVDGAEGGDHLTTMVMDAVDANEQAEEYADSPEGYLNEGFWNWPTGQESPDTRNVADTAWTEYFDEMHAAFYAEEGDILLDEGYYEYLMKDLATTVATAGNTAESASSLFQWALDHGGSGRIDSGLYDAIKDVLTGAPSVQVLMDPGLEWHVQDWRNTITAFGEVELGSDWLIDELDTSVLDPPLWDYPSTEDAKHGFDATTTLTPGGAYFEAMLGASKTQRDAFEAAWARAFPNRSKIADTKLRQDMFDDSIMASIIGGTSGYWEPEQLRYSGYVSDAESSRYESIPFSPNAEWLDDFIQNSSAHRTALYQNAIELADFLNRGAGQAKGEDYARAGNDEAAVARSLGFDLSDDAAKEKFKRWSFFNPLLYKADSDNYKLAEQNIIQLGVSALTPVHASRRVRAAWKSAIQARYDAWTKPEIGEAQDPNRFLKDLFASEGRVVGQRSTIEQPMGSTRMGSMTDTGYQESFTQPY